MMLQNTPDKPCPYCHEVAMESIVINFDVQTGMMRCKSCYKRLRLKDYDNVMKAIEISRGGRIDDE